jgi:hypothetical protein
MIDIYAESRDHNVGLNRKLLFNENFNVFNYFGHNQTIGNNSLKNINLLYFLMIP